MSQLRRQHPIPMVKGQSFMLQKGKISVVNVFQSSFFGQIKYTHACIDLFRGICINLGKTFSKFRDLQGIPSGNTDQNPSGPSAIHRVASPKPKEACHRCGLTNHKAADCHFKEATCHNCGRKRHLKRACRSGKKPQKGERPPTAPK